jgi:hypothetical protein
MIYLLLKPVLFIEYKTHKYGVSSVYKHFLINETELFVDFYHASTVWKVGHKNDRCGGDVGRVYRPSSPTPNRSFRLVYERPTPYEFAFSWQRHRMTRRSRRRCLICSMSLACRRFLGCDILMITIQNYARRSLKGTQIS